MVMMCSQKPGGQGSSYQSSGCTLPRQHWPTYTSGIRHHQQVPGSSMCVTSYPSPGAVASLHHHSHPHLHHQAPPPTHSQLPPEATASSTTAVVKSQKQPLLLAGPALGEEELPTAETPLMVTKRESTVWLVTKLWNHYFTTVMTRSCKTLPRLLSAGFVKHTVFLKTFISSALF